MKEFFGLFIIVSWITMVVGWIINLIHLATLDAFVLSGELIIRIIGVVIAPIGGIMGLFF